MNDARGWMDNHARRKRLEARGWTRAADGKWIDARPHERTIRELADDVDVRVAGDPDMDEATAAAIADIARTAARMGAR